MKIWIVFQDYGHYEKPDMISVFDNEESAKEECATVDAKIEFQSKRYIEEWDVLSEFIPQPQ